MLLRLAIGCAICIWVASGSVAWPDEGGNTYRLPSWFDAHRVQAYTRLSQLSLKRRPEVFFHAGELMSRTGVRVFCRQIKSGGEGAWWPSEVGAVDDATKDRNLAKDIIDEAHKAGCRLLVNYRHMEDDALAQAHADWVCRDWQDEPYRRRGTMLCLNSPYADFVLKRLLELASYGADGFYFDESHMPKQGCWCESCKHRFLEETGLEHPQQFDPTDQRWHQLADFTNRSIESTFLRWRQELRAKYPDLVLVVGSHMWPTMSDRHMTNRLFRTVDSMKTEFSLSVRTPTTPIFPLPHEMKPWEPDAKIALGYTLSRDACDGRPAHVWVPPMFDATAAIQAAAVVMTHGSIAALDVPEQTIPNAALKPAIALGERVSPFLTGTSPVRFVAIHYSEAARDRHLSDPDEAWRRVLYPVYGVYKTLLRARWPVGIVTDSQLEDGALDRYQALFLPSPDSLAPAMQYQVDLFRARGGLVIEQDPNWEWHEAEDQASASRNFLEALSARSSALLYRITGGPEKMHAVGFTSSDGKRLTICLSNDFTWVIPSHHLKKELLEKMATKPSPPPPPCRGVQVVLPNRPVPPRIREIVTGKVLAAKRVDNRFVVAVPDFPAMAVVVVE